MHSLGKSQGQHDGDHEQHRNERNSPDELNEADAEGLDHGKVASASEGQEDSDGKRSGDAHSGDDQGEEHASPKIRFHETKPKAATEETTIGDAGIDAEQQGEPPGLGGGAPEGEAKDGHKAGGECDGGFQACAQKGRGIEGSDTSQGRRQGGQKEPGRGRSRTLALEALGKPGAKSGGEEIDAGQDCGAESVVDQ